ncbi:MAG: 4a-hydroxytetrahydrobiopterin dehydratase [Poseidonia sp.]
MLNAPENWSVIEGRLMREFAFPDFDEAKAFIDQVSDLCNALNHHAELHFGWGYAVVETFSHDTQSITQRDIDLAQAINEMEARA